MTRQQLREMDYQSVGKIDGIYEVWDNFESRFSVDHDRGFVYQFNDKQEEHIGCILMSKEVLKKMLLR